LAKLNSFNTLWAVVGAFLHFSIDRLHQIWDDVPKAEKEVHKKHQYCLCPAAKRGVNKHVCDQQKLCAVQIKTRRCMKERIFPTSTVSLKIFTYMYSLILIYIICNVYAGKTFICPFVVIPKGICEAFMHYHILIDSSMKMLESKRKYTLINIPASYRILKMVTYILMKLLHITKCLRDKALLILPNCKKFYL